MYCTSLFSSRLYVFVSELCCKKFVTQVQSREVLYIVCKCAISYNFSLFYLLMNILSREKCVYDFFHCCVPNSCCQSILYYLTISLMETLLMISPMNTKAGAIAIFPHRTKSSLTFVLQKQIRRNKVNHQEKSFCFNMIPNTTILWEDVISKWFFPACTILFETHCRVKVPVYWIDVDKFGIYGKHISYKDWLLILNMSKINWLW